MTNKILWLIENAKAPGEINRVNNHLRRQGQFYIDLAVNTGVPRWQYNYVAVESSVTIIRLSMLSPSLSIQWTGGKGLILEESSQLIGRHSSSSYCKSTRSGLLGVTC